MGSQQPTAIRNEQLVRILSILRDLDRLGGADLYELAERYGTTVRTIRRDLDALQDVGLPLVEESEGKRKRWRVAYRDRIQHLSGLLDATHYLALRVAISEMPDGPPAPRPSPLQIFTATLTLLLWSEFWHFNWWDCEDEETLFPPPSGECGCLPTVGPVE